MPPQVPGIVETMLELRAALKREKEATSEQRISSATNRGNKLKRGAGFIHTGSIPYRYGSHAFKERVSHGGFQRYILERNPHRFNEDGDQLPDSESDDGADADAETANPYSDVRLEELLRPLTHPAELADHPTLSYAYLDPALPDLVQNTEAQLRQERANLWHAKNLYRQFVGDISWMPCGNVEASDDWDLFEPQRPITSSISSKKRKRRSDEHMVENGIAGQDHAKDESTHNGMNGVNVTNGVSGLHNLEHSTDGLNQQDNLVDPSGAINPEKEEEDEDKPEKPMNDIDMANDDEPKINGAQRKDLNSGVEVNGQRADDKTTANEKESNETLADNERRNEDDNETTPPPPTRRITRALAAADTSNAATPPLLSPTTSTISSLSSSLLQPAPLFLLPAHLTLAHSTHPPSHLPLHVAHSGLPIDEIIETRRLLGMYIQKQEETIRGLEGVLGKLIKAKRMKDQLFEWCKAEGHVGEWSDGEDWIDAEAWDLRAEELRKGRDEEEVEVQEEGRKGKRRRGAARD